MTSLPLQGIRVVDFTWLIAGPLATKYLADYGAEVIRIESMRQVDRMRVAAPYKDKTPGINRSGFFNFFNANKYGLRLNLKNPAGLNLAKRLITTADIVIDNFRSGVMTKLGLGYESLKQVKPDIIAASLSPFGATGPYSHLAATGHQIAAGAGFVSLTGWPDRDTVPPYGPLPDFIAARYAASALLAAVSYRRKTGKGQFLDLSQFEASLTFLSPLLLDSALNHHVLTPRGNRAPNACPHGVYRCKGDDSWCAIAVSDDAEWNSFGRAIGSPGWTKKREFGTLSGRKQHEDEIDKLVEIWTTGLTAVAVMKRLQAAGVAAGAVKNQKEILEDPQLSHRHAFWRLNHPEIGPFSFLGGSFHLEKTPARPRMPAPCLGEHTEYVCREILHMSDDEFLSLMNQEVFD